nr:FHA domain-containing protein [uncultured Anaerobutyricum sp.]
MKVLLMQLITLVILVIIVYVVLKVAGFIGGKEIRLPFFKNRKKMFNQNKTVIVNDWAITELDEAGYSTSNTSEINFKKSEFYIGKNKSNDFVINNKTVSGKHAVIKDTVNGLVLKDNASTNGVKHNGKQITEIILKDGMILQFGTVYCKFSNSESDGIMDYIPEETKVEIKDTCEKEEFVQRKL